MISWAKCKSERHKKREFPNENKWAWPKKRITIYDSNPLTTNQKKKHRERERWREKERRSVFWLRHTPVPVRMSIWRDICTKSIRMHSDFVLFNHRTGGSWFRFELFHLIRTVVNVCILVCVCACLFFCSIWNSSVWVWHTLLLVSDYN